MPYYTGRVTVTDRLPEGDPRRLTQDEIDCIEHVSKNITGALHEKLQARRDDPVSIGVRGTRFDAVWYQTDRFGYPTRALIRVDEPLTDAETALGWRETSAPGTLRSYGVQ